MSSRGAEDDARLTGRTCPNLDSAGTGRPVRDHFADFARRRRSGLYLGLGCRRARHVSRGEKGPWSPFHSHNVLTYLSSQHQGQDHHSSPQGKDGLIKRGRDAAGGGDGMVLSIPSALFLRRPRSNQCGVCLTGVFVPIYHFTTIRRTRRHVLWDTCEVRGQTHKTSSFLVHWLYLRRTTLSRPQH